MIVARAFPGTLDAAVEAEAWASEEAERRSLTPDVAYALSLCLEELFVNAVRHGGAREVRLALDDEVLEFRDDGLAFNPTLPTPKRLEGDLDFEIGGFGLGLLQSFAGKLGYLREAGWNVVRLALPR